MTINKAQLHQHCLALLTERIRELEEAVANVQESRNNETKSSAGDKYETSRAMMQQEEDKLLARLDNTRQMQLQLQQLNPTQQQESAEMGALITTNQRTYYLGVSLLFFGIWLNGSFLHYYRKFLALRATDTNKI